MILGTVNYSQNCRNFYVSIQISLTAKRTPFIPLQDDIWAVLRPIRKVICVNAFDLVAPTAPFAIFLSSILFQLISNEIGNIFPTTLVSVRSAIYQLNESFLWRGREQSSRVDDMRKLAKMETNCGCQVSFINFKDGKVHCSRATKLKAF